MGHRVAHRKVRRAEATEPSDDGNGAVHPARDHRFGQRLSAAQIDDEVGSATVSDPPHVPLPFGVGAVVDEVVGAEPLADGELLVGGRGEDDRGPSCLRQLHGKEGDATGALGDDRVAAVSARVAKMPR